MAYKLEAYGGRPRRKRSPGTETWPGAKQVFRERDALGRLTTDSIGLVDEVLPGEPRLHEVMRDGRRVSALPDLATIRELTRERLAQLPAVLRSLEPGGDEYPVSVSDRLRGLARSMDESGE